MAVSASFVSNEKNQRKAARLYKSGMTIAKVATELGIGHGTAHKMITAGGGKTRPRGYPAGTKLSPRKKASAPSAAKAPKKAVPAKKTAAKRK